MRAPFGGVVSDRLRHAAVAYAAAQPVGFGPEWTPWGGIVAILVRSLPPPRTPRDEPKRLSNPAGSSGVPGVYRRMRSVSAASRMKRLTGIGPRTAPALRSAAAVIVSCRWARVTPT